MWFVRREPEGDGRTFGDTSKWRRLKVYAGNVGENKVMALNEEQ